MPSRREVGWVCSQGAKAQKNKTKEEALKTGNTTLKILRRKVQMQLGGLQPRGGVSLKGLVIRIALYRILVTVWYTWFGSSKIHVHTLGLSVTKPQHKV